eukprot:TRINITY_DN28753_c0_g1_i1.p1 TRINITY_DN28753_c0_g1~~TRINITY_DN28753_c0_g1_i1.p1  ORF type:complete len:414 (-),score=26.46 TRINITY_DN28753_c0_g1_i1:157-1398(-)
MGCCCCKKSRDVELPQEHAGKAWKDGACSETSLEKNPVAHQSHWDDTSIITATNDVENETASEVSVSVCSWFNETDHHPQNLAGLALEEDLDHTQTSAGTGTGCLFLQLPLEVIAEHIVGFLDSTFALTQAFPRHLKEPLQFKIVEHLDLCSGHSLHHTASEVWQHKTEVRNLSVVFTDREEDDELLDSFLDFFGSFPFENLRTFEMHFLQDDCQSLGPLIKMMVNLESLHVESDTAQWWIEGLQNKEKLRWLDLAFAPATIEDEKNFTYLSSIIVENLLHSINTQLPALSKVSLQLCQHKYSHVALVNGVLDLLQREKPLQQLTVMLNEMKPGGAGGDGTAKLSVSTAVKDYLWMQQRDRVVEDQNNFRTTACCCEVQKKTNIAVILYNTISLSRAERQLDWDRCMFHPSHD